jgi:putative flavoprotein involved in K+ transport
LLPAGWLDETPETLPDPRIIARVNPQTSGLGPQGHTISLQGLEALGVHLLGRPVSVEGGRLSLEDTVGAAIAFGDARSAEFIATMDRAIDERGWSPPRPEPDPSDVPHSDPASVRSPTAVDLDREGISCVIWTTGFTGDFGYLPPEALDTTGRPIHRRGIGATPGLYFTGLPWLAKRRSGIIVGLDEGGRLAADQVASGLEGG